MAKYKADMSASFLGINRWDDQKSPPDKDGHIMCEASSPCLPSGTISCSLMCIHTGPSKSHIQKFSPDEHLHGRFEM